MTKSFEITGVCMEARMPLSYTPNFDANHGVTFERWKAAVDRILIIRCGMPLDKTWVGTSSHSIPATRYLEGLCPVTFVKREFPRHEWMG